MHVCPFSYYFFPPTYKYCPKFLLLSHTQTVFISDDRPRFTHKITGIIAVLWGSVERYEQNKMFPDLSVRHLIEIK